MNCNKWTCCRFMWVYELRITINMLKHSYRMWKVGNSDAPDWYWYDGQTEPVERD